MGPEQRSELIKTLASEAGFHLCGLAHAEALTSEEAPYRSWLDRKQWGNMDYLRNNFEKRLDPGKVMPGVRTVVSVLAGYHPGIEIPEEDNYIIARYARGRDYHVHIRKMLDRMVSLMEERFPGIRCKPFVDSGVLLEKAWAQQCGIGWRGKNTLLINRSGGSWFFIGLILTDLETAPDLPERDRCGTCERCIKACPTGALEGPHLLNPLRCISYHTIEKSETIPAELAGKFRGRIFGCDICQEVCPYNADPFVTDDPTRRPDPALVAMRRHDWDNLTPERFSELFSETSVARTGYRLFMRNIRFASESGEDQPPQR